jgi:hypothetical protein
MSLALFFSLRNCANIVFIGIDHRSFGACRRRIEPVASEL